MIISSTTHDKKQEIETVLLEPLSELKLTHSETIFYQKFKREPAQYTSTIPRDLLTVIFSFLNAETKLNCSRVNSECYDTITETFTLSDSLWLASKRLDLIPQKLRQNKEIQAHITAGFKERPENCLQLETYGEELLKMFTTQALTEFLFYKNHSQKTHDKSHAIHTFVENHFSEGPEVLARINKTLEEVNQLTPYQICTSFAHPPKSNELLTYKVVFSDKTLALQYFSLRKDIDIYLCSLILQLHSSDREVAMQAITRYSSLRYLIDNSLRSDPMELPIDYFE